eukprot:m.748009 g.748009  ORF g.748009 m.748009 type:complete len:183 (+) comp23148_c0_seq14:1419-1967(+)
MPLYVGSRLVMHSCLNPMQSHPHVKDALIAVQKSLDNSTLAILQREVTGAIENQRQSKLEIRAQAATKLFSPFAFFIAAIAMRCAYHRHPLSQSGRWRSAWDAALAVLMSATPCPLAIGVPVAFLSGLACSARMGVWFVSVPSLTPHPVCVRCDLCRCSVDRAQFAMCFVLLPHRACGMDRD